MPTLTACGRRSSAKRPPATRIAAHDASRDFHLRLAQATGNRELVSMLEALWIVEIGRRLLAARATSADWRGSDVAEHRAIAAAVAARDGELAAQPDDRPHRRGAPALAAGAA